MKPIVQQFRKLMVRSGGLALALIAGGMPVLAPGFSADLAAQPAGAPPVREAGAANAGASVVFRGRIVNGTASLPARADELTLLELGQGMRPVQTIQNAGPAFAFDPVPRPQAPHLIRATFQGESYTALVPPSEEFWSQRQEVVVYERGAKRSSLDLRSGVEVWRFPDKLRVQKAILIQNQSQPPRSFDTDNHLVFIPPGAENLEASLQHESSRMPVPLQMKAVAPEDVAALGGPAVAGYHRIGRGFRPGASQLRLRYEVPGQEFTDRFSFEPRAADAPAATGAESEDINWDGSRVVLWHPETAKPDVEGGRAMLHDGPGQAGGTGQQAYIVSYPEGGEVRYLFRAGGYTIENPMADQNPIFQDHLRSGLGLALALAVLLGLLAVFTYGRSRTESAAQED